MQYQLLTRHASLIRLGLYIAAAFMALALLWSLPARNEARGQASGTPAADGGPSSAAAPTTADAAPAAPPATSGSGSINILELAIAGGIFMIPIAALSLLAVAMSIERLLGLRASRVLPSGLV